MQPELFKHGCRNLRGNDFERTPISAGKHFNIRLTLIFLQQQLLQDLQQ